MKHGKARRGRALLFDGEIDTRLTISKFLQLHAMEVVEAETLDQVAGHLAGAAGFDLLVSPLKTPDHPDWQDWKAMLARESQISVLVHGSCLEEWNEIAGELGDRAGFIGQPFTFSDFHWALLQLGR